MNDKHVNELIWKAFCLGMLAGGTSFGAGVLLALKFPL